MDIKDAIANLAQVNGKSFFPLREDEVDDLKVPYFEVSKTQRGYAFNYFNYANHDNSPRMPYYCDFLAHEVFPHVDKECDLTGYYPIELHDAISYLDNGVNYENVLTFAKRFEDKYSPLLPDPYMIGNYGGRLNIKDTLTWEQKANKVAFFGVTTGSKDPKKNTRLQLAQWSTKHRDFTDIHFTNIVQMPPDKVIQEYASDIQRMHHAPVSQDQQYKYKFLLSIDGNTCSYDRLCWIMNSQSLLFKYPSRDMLWYYPLIQEGTHYVATDTHTMKTQAAYYMNNPQHAKHVIANANHLVKTLLTPANTILYAKLLFENFAENKA